MKTIYADSLFITNLVIDYLLLLASAQVCGTVLKRRRYLLAAAVGSVYAVAVYLPGLGALAHPVMKLIAGLIMAYIAYYREARRVKCAMIFLAVSAAFGGFLWAIELAGGRPAFDTRALVAAFAACYVVMTAVFRRQGATADRPRVKAELSLAGKKSEFFALVDSGNGLIDPISNLPVMVICPHAAAPLFGVAPAVLHTDAVKLIERAGEIDALRSKLRLIPYSAVGGGGMLAAFKPESALIDGEAREILAAISPEVEGDGYEGII